MDVRTQDVADFCTAMMYPTLSCCACLLGILLATTSGAAAQAPCADPPPAAACLTYAGEPARSVELKGNERLAVRFTPGRTGTVDSVFFALDGAIFNNPAPVTGRGTLHISIAEAEQRGGSGSGAFIAPGTYLGAVGMALADLQPGIYNGVHLAGLGVNVQAGTDFFIEFRLEQATAQASVDMLVDNGSLDTDDRRYYPARTVLYANDPVTGETDYLFDLGSRNNNLLVIARVVQETATDAEAPLSRTPTPTLQPNYPNPFAEQTTIPFVLHRAAHVTVTVYDVLGRRVATLVDAHLPAGPHTARWKAAQVSTGFYFVRLETEGPAQSRPLAVRQQPAGR